VSFEAVGWHRRQAVAALAAVAIVCCSLWLLLPQLDRPYVYDDVSFALGARAVAATGLPYGNQGYLLHLYWLRDQWALWHPPLYIYLLGAVVWLFGDGERATRGLGVLSLLVAAAVSFDLARRAARGHNCEHPRQLLAGVLAVALLVLNPLAIQATMVLDIDNTVLMVLIAVTVWAVMRLPDRWSGRVIIGLALLFALDLWAKMTTPLALGAAIVFVRLFQGRGWGTGWRGAVQALAVCALGIVVFVVTWLVVSRALGLPIDYTLDVVAGEAAESSASSRDRLVSLAAFVSGVAPAILWIGPFFCLLFVASGLPALVRLIAGRGLRVSDLLVVLGSAIYLAYVFKLAGNFPKYHAAMLPLWSAAAGALVARVSGRSSLLQWAVVLAAGAALTVWLLPQMAENWDIQFESDLNQNLIVAPALVSIGVATLWTAMGGRAVRAALIGAVPVALLVATLSWNVALDLSQRDRMGSTTYYYGRYGQRATAEALDAILRPEETYVASKDVAWYTHHQNYVDQESWQHVVWDVDDARFDGTYLDKPIRVLALEVGEPTFRKAYDGLLLPRGYQYAGEFGNFLIYVRD